jgi:hypothetical protein
MKIHLLATLPLALVILAGGMEPGTAAVVSCAGNYAKCQRACGDNRPDCSKVCEIKHDACQECASGNAAGHSATYCQNASTQEVNPGTRPPKVRPSVAKPGGSTKQQ